MTPIPKPKHCRQNWLEMTPSDGGRLCGQCRKVIVDFSKKSWKEIEQLQQQNNNSLCGMYHSKQLDNWGQEIYSRKDNLLKVATITGLTMTLALPAYSQTTNQVDSVFIKGHVKDLETGEDLPFANVTLKHNNLRTTSDIDGNFKLVVSNLTTNTLPDTLEVSYVGYRSAQIIFQNLTEFNNHKDLNSDEGELTIALIPEAAEIIAFYITKPTLKQRMKSKFRRWFRRKD
jgi:CarboxypepD_reg-like domain